MKNSKFKRFKRIILALAASLAFISLFASCEEFWNALQGDVGYLEVVGDDEDFRDIQIHVQIYKAVPTGNGSYSMQEKLWDSKYTDYKLGLAEMDSIDMGDYLTPGDYIIVKAAYKKGYYVGNGEYTSDEYVTLKCVTGRGATAYPAQGGYNLKIHMGEKSYYNAGNYLYYEWVYEGYNYGHEGGFTTD